MLVFPKMSDLAFDRKEIFFSRLFILLSAIAIPIYFIILVAFIPSINLPFLNVIITDTALERLITTALVVIYFSLPIDFIIFIKRYNLANTLLQMRRNTVLIPLKWRLFYGFNALVITLFFVLPFIAPILSVIMIVFIVGRIIGKYYHPDYHNKFLSIFLFLTLTIIFEIPAVYLAIQFIPEYIPIATNILKLWFENIYVVSTLSILLVDTLTFGSLIEFIFLYRIDRELDSIGVIVSQVPRRKIFAFESVFYTGLVLFWISKHPFSFIFINYLNMICLGIVAMLFIIGLLTGVRRRKVSSGLAGLFFAAAFSAVYLFEQINREAITILYGISFVLFVAVFVISYKQAQKLYAA